MRMRSAFSIDGNEPIHVTRDDHGIPHIRSTTEPDLYRGLGYCHATDRGLQMFLARVICQGRGCEVLSDSEDTLRLDTFFRQLNFGGDTSDELTKLSPAHRMFFDAYCDGVNDAARRRAPWELRLLGYRPEPWTVADSLTLLRAMAYVSLAQSQADMERLILEMVQAGLPRPHLDELFPNLLDGLDAPLVRQVTLGERIVPQAIEWNHLLPRAMASNNWVIAGRKTRSGTPLLANDPHLEANRLPAIWYEVVLELGERFCTGATMPGLPGTGAGRTNDLAWGVTYSFMDAVDSWVEDCRDGKYRRATTEGERWIPFRIRREVIRRKKKPPTTVTFYENDHGTLDGDPSVAGLYLTTRWAAGTRSGARSAASLLGLFAAPDVPSGMELVGQVESAWNWVLADRHGNIGYQMSGRMPRRASGQRGLVPLPGWDPANDWQGFVEPTELPRVLNPDSGFIVTANDDLNHLGQTHPINLPMGGYRAERIAELLAARDDWDVAATQQMQMDVVSPHAARFMEVLRPLLPATPHGDALRAWDVRYDRDSTGAYLFERFYHHLLHAVFGRFCGPDVLWFLTEQTGILTDFYANFDDVLLRPDSVWYGEEGRDAAFRRVAAAALSGPIKTWGETQQISMQHLLFAGKLPAWLGFDYGPVPLQGGRGTIHQGQVYRSRGRATSFAPSYRLVTNLGESAVYTCLAGGPSDRRFSPWYTSGIESWLAGRFKKLAPGR